MSFLDNVPDYLHPLLVPHLAALEKEAFEKGYLKGKLEGQSEVIPVTRVLCSMVAQHQLVPPQVQALLPVGLSQPLPAPAPEERATDGDDTDGELNLDAMLDELFAGEWSEAEKQEIVGIAMVAIREAADAQGFDPEPYIQRLTALAGNGNAVRRVMMGHPVWLGWQPIRIDNPRGRYQYKAVGTGEHQGRVAYGADAERKLRKGYEGGEGDPDADTVAKENREYAEAREKARAKVAEITKSLSEGRMLKNAEWQEFTGQLKYLTGAHLKELRGQMVARLMQKVRAGKRKADRIQNLESAIRSVVQYGVTRSFQEDYGKGESVIGEVRSRGGLDPDSHAFRTFFGDANEAMQSGLPVRKGGQSLDTLAQSLAAEGVIVVPEGEDPAQVLVDAMTGKRKVSGVDDSKYWGKELENHYLQQEYDAANDDAPAEPESAVVADQPAVEDDSFDFGANAQQEPAPAESQPETAPASPASPAPEPAAEPEQTFDAVVETEPAVEQPAAPEPAVPIGTDEQPAPQPEAAQPQPEPEPAPAEPEPQPAPKPAVKDGLPVAKPDGVPDAAWAAFTKERDKLRQPGANLPPEIRGKTGDAKKAALAKYLKQRHPDVFAPPKPVEQPKPAEETPKQAEQPKFVEPEAATRVPAKDVFGEPIKGRPKKLTDKMVQANDGLWYLPSEIEGYDEEIDRQRGAGNLRGLGRQSKAGGKADAGPMDAAPLDGPEPTAEQLAEEEVASEPAPAPKKVKGGKKKVTDDELKGIIGNIMSRKSDEKEVAAYLSKLSKEERDAAAEALGIPKGKVATMAKTFVKSNETSPPESRPKLTRVESEAVKKYTGDSYRAVNHMLRQMATGMSSDAAYADYLDKQGLTAEDTQGAYKSHSREAAESAIKGLESVFSKLKPFSRPVTVYRGTRISDSGLRQAFIDKLMESAGTGSPITLPGYSSTSTKESTAENFTSDGRFMFEITAKKGLDVSPQTAIDEEKEILLDNMSQFKIAHVKEPSDGQPYYYVVMEQL